MADLLGDGDSDDNSGFNINKSYADKYDNWRGKEELQKFADRYGEEALDKLDNSDESSTSTEEDDDAKEVTPQFEKQFFKTLSCLKKKDPKIYDANVKFFEKKNSSDAQDKAAAAQKKKKDKKMFLRDYERKMLLERGGQISSDEEEEEERACSPTFVQEQKAIKQSFKAVLNNDSDEDDETEGIGGLLKPRQKTEEEKTREEEEYREWLKGRKKELSNEEDSKDLGYLKDYWSDPKLEQNEAFLRDYILNKRYLEDEDKEYIPTYDELVHDSDEGGLSGDERTVEEMEKFEHKYNFRYEEPDQEFVKRYPRTTQSSLRLQDDRRRKHREEVRQRKLEEKEVKRHELLQLKAIKRKEIAERLEKLKEITGNTDIQFMDEDLNEDFDPEKHDQRMQKLFNTEYYDAEADEEKPEFPDLDAELEIENWDEYQPEQEGTSGRYEPHCEDPNFNMDCDYDPRAELQKEMMAAQSGRKKKNRKKSKLADLLSKKKPTFDPNQQQVEEYMDEYYALDYEDIVGDMPCRFKYRNVVANNYGLTIDEILRADDKELNRWCSLKKTSQYRSEQQELYDVHAYRKKAQLEALKRKILPSLFKDGDQENPEQEEKTKKKKKKKKAKKGTNKSESLENGDSELPQGQKEAKKRSHSEEDVTGSPSKKIKEEIPETEEPIKIKQEVLETEEPIKKKKKDKIPETEKPIKQEVLETEEPTKKKKKVSSEQDPSTERKNDSEKKYSAETSEHAKQNGSPVNGVKSKKNKDKANKWGAKSSAQWSNKQQNFGKQKSSNSNRQEDPVPAISDSRLKAYGFNPKKYKNKLKYGRKN